MSPGQRDPLVMETPRRFDGGSGLAEQDGIASEAKDKSVQRRCAITSITSGVAK